MAGIVDPDFGVRTRSTSGWYSEIKDYDFANSASKGTSVTGYFTQLVWKNSTKIGAGRAFGHRARIVTQYVASTKGGLELFFLPPYSPKLNPDEWVNKNVKHDRIARAVPLTRDDLKAVAVEALERLKTCPGTVRGFSGDPKLAYIHA